MKASLTLLVRTLTYAPVVLAFAACLWNLAYAAEFGNPRFSPNEEYLAFDYCQSKCNFVVYSLRTGTATTFDAPKHESWINPSFGPKGDRVVFVVMRKAADTQIATVKLNGTGFCELTASMIIKRSPSVSPDGRLVVFAGRSTTVTARGSYSAVDLYVTDVGTGKERRITDLSIRDIGSPFFLPDGEKVTFATTGSAYPWSKLPKDKILLDRLFPNRTVFVQSLTNSFRLEPVLQVPLIATQPKPVASGQIALLVRVNHIDHLKGPYLYDIFLAKDGKATRLTKFQSYVWSYGISDSAELVAYLTDGPSKTPRDKRLMLWRKSIGKSVKLRIQPAKRIPLTGRKGAETNRSSSIVISGEPQPPTQLCGRGRQLRTL